MVEDRDGVIAGYARALVAVGEAEDALDELADELFRFARSAEQTPDLVEELTSPAVSAGQRLDVIERLLGGRVSDVTVAAAMLLVRAGQARELSAIAEAFAREAAEAGRRVLAEVRSAVELDADQRARLAAALGEATGREVELKVTLDPSVVGGIVATVGDTVIDGSLSRRLSDLKSRFQS